MNIEEMMRVIKANSKFLEDEKSIPVITMCGNKIILDGISRALCQLDKVVVLAGINESVLPKDLAKLIIATGAQIVGSNIDTSILDEISDEEVFVLDMHIDEEKLKEISIEQQKTNPKLSNSSVEEIMENGLIALLHNSSLLPTLQEFSLGRKKTVNEIEEMLLSVLL